MQETSAAQELGPQRLAAVVAVPDGEPLGAGAHFSSLRLLTSANLTMGFSHFIVRYAPEAEKEATAGAIDKKIGFAVLELTIPASPPSSLISKLEYVPLGFLPPAPVLSADEPSTGEEWESAWFRRTPDNAWRTRGLIGASIPELHVVELQPVEPIPNRADMSGAPVTINGKLAGIVTNLSGRNSIFMIPLSEMVKSRFGGASARRS